MQHTTAQNTDSSCLCTVAATFGCDVQKCSVEEYKDEIRVLQTATSKWYLSILKHPPDVNMHENDSPAASRDTDLLPDSPTALLKVCPVKNDLVCHGHHAGLQSSLSQHSNASNAYGAAYTAAAHTQKRWHERADGTYHMVCRLLLWQQSPCVALRRHTQASSQMHPTGSSQQLRLSCQFLKGIWTGCGSTVAMCRAQILWLCRVC